MESTPPPGLPRVNFITLNIILRLDHFHQHYDLFIFFAVELTAQKRNNNFVQVLGALCAALPYLSIGLVRGWASPAVPSLDGNGSNYRIPQSPLDTDTRSWIGTVIEN